jgi:putative flippase GtrA
MNLRRGHGPAAEVGRFIRANLSSSAASLVDYVLVALLLLVRTHYLVAATVGALSGAVTDFSLKRHWAFDRTTKGAFHHEGLRYLLVSGASLLLNLVVAYALVDGLKVKALPGVVAASIVVGFLWNYPLHRLFVFRGGVAVGPGAKPRVLGGEK